MANVSVLKLTKFQWPSSSFWKPFIQVKTSFSDLTLILIENLVLKQFTSK